MSISTKQHAFEKMTVIPRRKEEKITDVDCPVSLAFKKYYETYKGIDVVESKPQSAGWIESLCQILSPKAISSAKLAGLEIKIPWKLYSQDIAHQLHSDIHGQKFVLVSESTASPVIFEEENRMLLENERLKSQIMAQRRALLASKKQENNLAAQNERLVDGICDLVKTNKTLQESVLARNDGRICFLENHRGVVSEVFGKQVEVTYEVADGALKQIYNVDQFLQTQLPKEGDSVEAFVILAMTKREQNQEKEDAFVSDLPNFGDKAISGPIRL